MPTRRNPRRFAPSRRYAHAGFNRARRASAQSALQTLFGFRPSRPSVKGASNVRGLTMGGVKRGKRS